MKKQRKIIAVLLFAVMVFGFFSPINSITAEAGFFPYVNEKKLTLQVGKSKKLTIENDKGLKKTFKSKDKKIAKVSKKGKITAISKGKTEITVTFSAPKKGSYEVKVSVTVEPKPFTTYTTTCTIKNLTQYRIWVKSVTGDRIPYSVAISTENDSEKLDMEIREGNANKFKVKDITYLGKIDASQREIEVNSSKNVVWINNRSGEEVEVTITITTADESEKMKDVEFNEAKLR